ncbi:cell division protein ZapA [Lentilactobacillus raoultii]|uniref:Cell division protein ZapA n=1 Tax=Lentilactobacillus raoultii TaxID=1987503 RepID=A0ABW3PRV2_9LACO|nr:cell division protein ZapA [Lentilactobacillus raoultii]
MSENEKRRFKTTIGGKKYILVGKGSDEHLQAVSDLLNEQLTQLRRAMPNASDEQRAILSAFNAISKQFELEERLTKIKGKSQSQELE